MSTQTILGRRLFRIEAFGAVISTIIGCAQFKQADLVRSVPIALSEPRENQVLEWAIETSLARHRWVILQHSDHTYLAQFSEHSHQATITIQYEEHAFRIDYVDSTNLLYEEWNGKELIHRRYGEWVKDLADEIQSLLVVASVPSIAPTRPPPPR
jgi:hypothetical protein